jgi:ribonuclease-3
MLSLLKKHFPVLFSRRYRSEPEETVNWQDLESKLSYKIQNKDIFREALRHRSHSSCLPPVKALSNERLEFLGDALINFYVGDFLYKTFAGSPEGDLTVKRSALVSREFLAKKGKSIELGKFLELGEGEVRSGGRYKNSILSNTIESVIGALYLDGGHEAASTFVQNVILVDYEKSLRSEGNNYKGDLLEYVQKRHLPMPKFITRRETGPDHKKTYIVAVKIGEEIYGTGQGKSKKSAEQKSARMALNKIKNNEKR